MDLVIHAVNTRRICFNLLAGIIADLIFTKNAAVNFGRKWCKRRKLFKIYIQTICLIVCIFYDGRRFDPAVV